MRLTIDIPDEQAHQLGLAPHDVEQLVKRVVSQISRFAFLDEITDFLGRDPKPEDIVAFHASDKSQARIRQLLDRNRTGTLNADEQSELKAVEALNHLLALLKTRAWQHLPAHS